MFFPGYLPAALLAAVTWSISTQHACAVAREDLVNCRNQPDAPAQLACYLSLTDSAAGYQRPDSVLPRVYERESPARDKQIAAAGSRVDRRSPPGCESTSMLDSQWNPECVRGDKLLAYKPNYLLLHYIPQPNNTPFTSQAEFTSAQQPSADLTHPELKFQISGKTLLFDRLPGDTSLWLGYTQQSYWQVFDSSKSRPFRETDYSPEVILSRRLGQPLSIASSSYQLRYLSAGFLHESNGRGSGGLSRSWNRLYLNFGVENKANDEMLLVRPWVRTGGGGANGDNPDIEHYLGYGDVTWVKRFANGHAVSLLMRNNLQSQNNRGALQFDWSVPGGFGSRNLNWHVQIFSGYGENLIDYNHRQNSIGIGIDLIPQLGVKARP